ncbi:MAG: hypothetical protein GY696_39895, partial [Gammaproteobacteria bacterium]|nr:hypothetical protein [Gammaproteobacteria bacterium]
MSLKDMFPNFSDEFLWCCFYQFLNWYLELTLNGVLTKELPVLVNRWRCGFRKGAYEAETPDVSPEKKGPDSQQMIGGGSMKDIADGLLDMAIGGAPVGRDAQFRSRSVNQLRVTLPVIA